MTAGHTAPLFSVEIAGVRAAGFSEDPAAVLERRLVVASSPEEAIAAALVERPDAEIVKVERSGDIDAIAAHALPLPFFLVTPVEGLALGIAATTAAGALELAKHRCPELEVQRVEQCGTLVAVPPDCPALVYEAPTGASASFEAATIGTSTPTREVIAQHQVVPQHIADLHRAAAAVAGHPDPVPLIEAMARMPKGAPPPGTNWVEPVTTAAATTRETNVRTDRAQALLDLVCERATAADLVVVGRAFEMSDGRFAFGPDDVGDDEIEAVRVRVKPIGCRRGVDVRFDADFIDAGFAGRATAIEAIDRELRRATLTAQGPAASASSDAPPITAITLAAAQALEGVRAVAGVPANMPPHEVPAWVERKLRLLRQEAKLADVAIEDIAKAARFPAAGTWTTGIHATRALLVEHVGALRRRGDAVDAATLEPGKDYVFKAGKVYEVAAGQPAPQGAVKLTTDVPVVVGGGVDLASATERAGDARTCTDDLRPLDAFLALADRFLGVSLEFRPVATGWPAPWRAELVTGKNERAEYRTVKWWTTAEGAAQSVLDHVAQIDRRHQDEINTAAAAATPIGEMRAPHTLKVSLPESDADDVPAIEAPPEAVQRANATAELRMDRRVQEMESVIGVPAHDSESVERVAGGYVQFRGAIARALGEFENASDETLIKRADWLRGEVARGAAGVRSAFEVHRGAAAASAIGAAEEVASNAQMSRTAGLDSGYVLGERGVPRTRAGDLMRIHDEAREREARQADEIAEGGAGPLLATWLKAREARRGFENLKTPGIGQQPTDQTAEECGINALKWAAVFCEANPHPDPAALRALMAGWFALAIQRALDLAGKARAGVNAAFSASIGRLGALPQVEAQPSSHQRAVIDQARWLAGLGPQELARAVGLPPTQDERDQLRQARSDLEDAKRQWDADVDKCGSAISFLMGVLDRVRRSTTLSAAWSYAAAGEDRIARWHLGAWQPGPHDDPAQWAGVKLTTPGPVTSFETAETVRISERLALADSLAGAVREALKVPPSVADADLPTWVMEDVREPKPGDVADPDALNRQKILAIIADMRKALVERRLVIAALEQQLAAEKGAHRAALAAIKASDGIAKDLARLLDAAQAVPPPLPPQEGRDTAALDALTRSLAEALGCEAHPITVQERVLALVAQEAPSPAHRAMLSGLARAAARYEQTGLMVRGDGSLWDDDMRNALAAAREAGLAPPPAPLDPTAARACWVPPDAVVLTDTDARAYREFQRASIAMEDAHRAYADRQREHSAAMVALGRAAAASGRAAEPGAGRLGAALGEVGQ